MSRSTVLVCAVLLLLSFCGLAEGLVPSVGFDADGDPDRDGLTNAEEQRWGTDPLDPDSDGGGCPDGWEVWYEEHRAVDDAGDCYMCKGFHFDPNSDVDDGTVASFYPLIQVRDLDPDVHVDDPDNDGWTNHHEFLVGTDPTDPNTDDDSWAEDAWDPDPLVNNDVPHCDGCCCNGYPNPVDAQGDGHGSGSDAGEGFGDPGPQEDPCEYYEEG